MARIDDGKHVCPIMSGKEGKAIACSSMCACLCKNRLKDEEYTYCGMMPPDSYVE